MIYSVMPPVSKSGFEFMAEDATRCRLEEVARIEIAAGGLWLSPDKFRRFNEDGIRVMGYGEEFYIWLDENVLVQDYSDHILTVWKTLDRYRADLIWEKIGASDRKITPSEFWLALKWLNNSDLGEGLVAKAFNGEGRPQVVGAQYVSHLQMENFGWHFYVASPSFVLDPGTMIVSVYV